MVIAFLFVSFTLWACTRLDQAVTLGRERL